MTVIQELWLNQIIAYPRTWLQFRTSIDFFFYVCGVSHTFCHLIGFGCVNQSAAQRTLHVPQIWPRNMLTSSWHLLWLELGVWYKLGESVHKLLSEVFRVLFSSLAPYSEGEWGKVWILSSSILIFLGHFACIFIFLFPLEVNRT